jgi:hypothetical protein
MVTWRKCGTRSGCEQADLGPYRLHVDPTDNGGAVWMVSHSGVGASYWAPSVQEAKLDAEGAARDSLRRSSMFIVESVQEMKPRDLLR